MRLGKQKPSKNIEEDKPAPTPMSPFKDDGRGVQSSLKKDKNQIYEIRKKISSDYQNFLKGKSDRYKKSYKK